MRHTTQPSTQAARLAPVTQMPQSPHEIWQNNYSLGQPGLCKCPGNAAWLKRLCSQEDLVQEVQLWIHQCLPVFVYLDVSCSRPSLDLLCFQGREKLRPPLLSDSISTVRQMPLLCMRQLLLVLCVA